MGQVVVRYEFQASNQGSSLKVIFLKILFYFTFSSENQTQDPAHAKQMSLHIYFKDNDTQ